MASGQSASAHGLNTEGMKRRGFSELISTLKKLTRSFYRQGLTLQQAIDKIEDELESSKRARCIHALDKDNSRGIVR